jgi:hypothetical protein
VWPLGPRNATTISAHNDIRRGFAQLSEHPRSTPEAYSQMHAQSTNQCVQKVRGSRWTSHSILILFTCAVPYTKSKGLLIDVMFYPYTFYTRSVMYKKQATLDRRPILSLYFLHTRWYRFPINDYCIFHTQSTSAHEKQGVSIYIHHTTYLRYPIKLLQYKFDINKVLL